MADIVQTIEVVEPQKQKIPMPHYADETLSTHATAAYQDKTLIVSYYAPTLENVLAAMSALVANSNQFIEGDEFEEVVVGVNISLAPDNPITWSITYKYPKDVSEYYNDNADEFGVVTAPLGLTEHNISSYSLSVAGEPSRFAESTVFVGLKFPPLNYNRQISFFEPLDDPDAYEDPFIDLPVNIHTTSVSMQKTENVDGIDVWQYTWSGSLLST